MLAPVAERPSSTKYLPHIDGLRALAVLAVFVYHLVPHLSLGGYMGVDIFFVISGFLITRIIKDKTADNTFSLSGFYIRRARRIMPALIATVLITLFVGLVFLSPEKLTELAKTGIWSLTGLSNFYFYNHLGYFDLDADSQLFLHTWSLAVEEQFYLIWPSLLLLILSLGKKNQNNALLSLVVLGMVVSFWLTKTNPNAAFYMMPSRMGEFAFGAILNFFTFKQNGHL
jgi:peptidoglycan/LPS O-acetylase OafA/YrhL